MKRIISSLLIIAFIVNALVISAVAETDDVGIWDGTVATGFNAGSGTKADPFVISNGAELAFFSQQIQNKKTYSGNYFVLANDIYLNDPTFSSSWNENNAPDNIWTCFGSNNDSSGSIAFRGIFDGNNHSIVGLYSVSGGLFGECRYAEIKNITISNSFVYSTEQVGTILNEAYYSCKISNCDVVNSLISGKEECGGIIGHSGSGTTISNCQNHSIVKGKNSVGGIAGNSWSSKYDACANYGEVSGTYYIGGIIGELTTSTGGGTTVSACTNYGAVSGSKYVGGIAGKALESDYALIIEKCINKGSITGRTDYVGGIAGYTYTCGTATGSRVAVDQCANKGTIKGRSYVGGVIGWGHVEEGYRIDNVYNTGDIIGTSYTFGILSFIENKFGYYAYVENAFNYGKIEADSVYGATASSNYYISTKNTYYLSSNLGSYNAGTSISIDDFCNPESFSGFDFNSVWKKGKDHPIFMWEKSDLPEDNPGAETNNFEGICTAGLPTLDETNAKAFLGFIYNCADYKGVRFEDNPYYKLLIGDYSDIEDEDQLDAMLIDFSLFVRASMNQQVTDAAYRVEDLSSKLIAHLEKKAASLTTLDHEIANEIIGKTKKQLKNEIVELLSSEISNRSGIDLGDDILENIDTAISTYDSLVKAPQKAMDFVNNVKAALDGAIYVLNQDIKGRTMYFNCYLSNRKNYSSANDDIFKATMEMNSGLIQESSYGSILVDFFGWIVGKDSWNHHIDTLNYWAESFYQLENSTGGHDFEYDTTAAICETAGSISGTCKKCGKTITENINAPGHIYYLDISIPSCDSEYEYWKYTCQVCGYSYTKKVERDESEDFSHWWSEGHVVQKATTEQKGITEYICNRCGEEKTVYVDKLSEDYIPVSCIEISKESVSTSPGKEVELTAIVGPEDATNKKVVWCSSNAKIVSVSDDGKITALKNGTATIIAKTEDGKILSSCTVEVKNEEIPIAKCKSHALSLTGNIGIIYNFYLSEEALKDSGAKVQFTITDGGQSEVLISKGEKKTNSDGVDYYGYSCDVHSSQMTGDVTAKIVLSDGRESEEFHYTVKQYADIIIKNKNNSAAYTEVTPLVKAMLNYGGYAQEFFNYDPSAPLANKDLSAAEKDVSGVQAEDLAKYASVRKGTAPEGISYKSATLILTSKTTIRYSFRLAEGHDISEFTFKNGNQVLTPYHLSDDVYCVEIPDVASSELDNMYTVTVGDFSVTYGALTYAYNKLKAETTETNPETLKNLLRALVLYNQEANEYFV